MSKKEADMFRKLAQELREKAAALKQEKMVKCAKYILGITALHRLQEKIRGR